MVKRGWCWLSTRNTKQTMISHAEVGHVVDPSIQPNFPSSLNTVALNECLSTSIFCSWGTKVRILTAATNLLSLEHRCTVCQFGTSADMTDFQQGNTIMKKNIHFWVSAVLSEAALTVMTEQRSQSVWMERLGVSVVLTLKISQWMYIIYQKNRRVFTLDSFFKEVGQ